MGKQIKTIYMIYNRLNGKKYIGCCSYFNARKRRHKDNALKGNYKKYSKLYKAMMLDGLNNFEFMKVERCNYKVAREREEYWIKHYNSYYGGYNCTKYGGGGISYWKGKKRSKATKEKITKALTGIKQTEETKKKRSLSLKKARAKYKDKWLKRKRR